MHTKTARRAYTRLDLGEAGAARISVSLSPYVSLIALLGGAGQGIPASVRDALSAALPAAGRRATLPLEDRPGLLPNFTVPVPPTADAGATDTIERVGELSADVVRNDLAATYGEHMPPGWHDAFDRPRHWAHGFAEATTAAWRVTKPLWQRAKPLLDREIERIGTVAVRAGAAAALATLGPAVRVRDGGLLIAGTAAQHHRLAGRELVLVPMISGTHAVVAGFDDDHETAWLGYPLPGLGNLWTGKEPREPAAAPDQLSLVVGEHRARALRRLDQPASMSELASALGCAPNTATYHCDLLAAAGLIERRRTGQSIRVIRTPRGDALMDLLAGR